MIVNKTALLALVKTCSGLTQYGVFWYNDPNYAVNATDKCAVKCRLRGYAGRGIDEKRYTYSAGSPGTMVNEQVGNRDVVLSLVVESWGLSAEASEVLDQIRTRLRRESSRDALLAINLALQTIDATIELPTTVDNRAVSVASMDIHLSGIVDDTLGTAPADIPTNPDVDTWIDTADISYVP